MDTFNIIGLIGTAITIIAYLLSSFNLLQVGILYQAMNFIGSMLLVISLTSHFNMPAIILETIWCAISISALVRILIKQRKRKNPPQN